MIGDRADWVRTFITDLPRLPCPRCARGRIKRIDGSEQKAEPHYAEDPEPPTLVYQKFVFLARCDHAPCGEVVCVSGDFSAEDIDMGDGHWPAETYTVRMMYPGPPLIKVPPNAPDAVRNELEQAFTAYWNDLDGCVSKLRRSVEAMLTDKGQAPKDSNGRFRTLHERINSIQGLGIKPDWLHAMRVVGNLGTHGEATVTDLFNAMDLWEIVIDELYGPDTHAEADRLTKMLKR